MSGGGGGGGAEKKEGGGEKVRRGAGDPAPRGGGSLAAMSAEEWRDDGLGGVFNRDGWTGRRNKEGMRIFKTHLLMRQSEVFRGGGKCPFDCNCCFI